MSTYTPKAGDITRTWHVIDATDVVLGRLAVQSATLLRGKHKPTYAPHMDMGDHVVIITPPAGWASPPVTTPSSGTP